MVIGRFEGRITVKNQIAFPKRFREKFGKKIIITKGLDKNLIVLPENGWKTLLEGTENKPFLDKNAREVQRLLFGNAAEIELDRQGRFVLPEYLKEYAGICNTVIFAGIERFVEMWDKKTWEDHQAFLQITASAIAERIVHQPESEERKLK